MNIAEIVLIWCSTV